MQKEAQGSTVVEKSTGIYGGNYFKWLINQIKGWPQQNYYLFWFAMGAQIMTLVSAPITPLTLLTFIGTTLGVLCVLSINAASSVNGILGLISAAIFIYVGFKAKNYLSIGEQTAYVLTLDLPVLLAVKTWNSETIHNLRKFGAKEWVISILGTIAVYAISGYLIGALTDDPRPWIDAIAFSISLTAGIMCFMRYNNQYYWWVASGLAQMVLWYVSFKQGSATLAMFINSSVYLANDVLAFTVSPWFSRGRKRAGLEKIK
ncbi:orf125 [Lactobacillus phage LP65]|uniref:Orf125 n=1 Tax=Lactobacillus phage LP65 TaxID=2892344 RepID=Q5ULI9_9CAUD|nr:PnuC-like nicotinamide mononucleotide transport [Lactobacillus phage LP65]AAV35945.1 orf125 [Lactobacillus phage LP65]